MTLAPSVLDAAEHVAPVLTARAAEIEAARTLPRDLVDLLVEAGLFRMLLPATHGGGGLDLPAARSARPGRPSPWPAATASAAGGRS